MANQVFDTTIVRPLARPSAADLNQMQGQIYRTVRAIDRLRYGYDLTNGWTGFLNYSFFVQNLSGSGLVLNISRGLGYIQAYSGGGSNIDGIPGLSDLEVYTPVFLTADKQFTVPNDVSSGKCRRDLLEVRWFRDNVDPVDLNIYDPTTKQFSTTSLDKTMTTDLAGKSVDFLAASVTPPATAYFIYKRGAEITYVDDGSFLAAPLPSVDAGCLALASINVKHGDAAIPNTRIADLRRLLGNDRQFTISGSATLGTNPDGSQYLDDVVINAPVGMRCTLSRLNKYEKSINPAVPFNQQYQFSVCGPRLAVLEPSFTVWGQLTNPAGASTLYPYPVSVTIQEKNTSSGLNVNAATATMFNTAAYSTPTMTAAVGQPYAYFKFAMNISEYGLNSNPGYYVFNKTDFTDFDTTTGTVDRLRGVSFVIVGQYAV